jgi:hypothetical protein
MWGTILGTVWMKHRNENVPATSLLLDFLALNDAIHSARLLASNTTFSHSDGAKGVSMPFCAASLRAHSSTDYTRTVSDTMPFLSTLLFLLSSHDPAVFSAASSQNGI